MCAATLCSNTAAGVVTTILRAVVVRRMAPPATNKATAATSEGIRTGAAPPVIWTKIRDTMSRIKAFLCRKTGVAASSRTKTEILTER